MKNAAELLDRARSTLIDEEGVYWTASDMLTYLNDAIQEVINLRPDIAAESSIVSLSPGSRQVLPPGMFTLRDVSRNYRAGAPGRAITAISLRNLEAEDVEWYAAPPATTVQHYVFDPALPTEFWVYPPNDGSGSVGIEGIAKPDEITDETDPLPFDARYHNALLWFVLSRAYLKDSSAGVNTDVASVYSKSFMQELGFNAGAKDSR